MTDAKGEPVVTPRGTLVYGAGGAGGGAVAAPAGPTLLWPLFDAVGVEYLRAKAKHGEMTLDGALATDLLRIAALGEEYGEVCEARAENARLLARVDALEAAAEYALLYADTRVAARLVAALDALSTGKPEE